MGRESVIIERTGYDKCRELRDFHTPDTRPLAPQTLTRGQIDFLVSHIKRLEKGEGINVSDQFWLDD